MNRNEGANTTASDTNMDVIMLNNRNAPTISEATSTFPPSQFDGNTFRDIETNVTGQKSEKVKESFSSYFKKVVKKSSKILRVLFIGVCAVLLIISAFMLYFVVVANLPFEDGDHVAPHEWLISRALWQAQPNNHTARTTPFDPVRLVIIQHTVTPTCFTFISCTRALLNLQAYFLINLRYDIPYNFMIGNDGRVYEGRGWGMEAAHTFTYNRCSLGLGFVGDYQRTTHPSELQLQRTKLLLEKGVQEGHLHPDYVIVAARDIRMTDSPGDNLVNELRLFEHFVHTDRFRDLTCESIYELLSLDQY